VPHDKPDRPEARGRARSANVEKGQSRSSALYGHVDYVDFAERVGLGITVEGGRLIKKKPTHR